MASTPADPGSFIATSPAPGSFPLVTGGTAPTLVVSAADHPGVLRVAGDLRADIERVTGIMPTVSIDVIPTAADAVPATADVVLVGTIGRCPLIDDLVAAGALDVTGIAGAWETSLQQVLADPLPGVGRAFVIAGSDPRGTIYGVYEVSRQIGVSPWYWWDDVPARHADALYVLPGRHSQGTPAVRYRGFFINDENPALGTWAPGHFGPGLAPGYPNGFNHEFYARVFETLLRLKGNYLWPAVWGRAFAEDDPDNHATATAYGVVMGTSHEAPMMRGIEEWNRHAVPAVRDDHGAISAPGEDPYGGTGEWSFRRNSEAITAYWADGVRRMVDEDIEGVVTLGMRGNGDVSLPDGDGIDLMREIIDTQRWVLADVTRRDASTLPQVWMLYKEVSRYWDKGLRVPDDVTVLLADDNWGNLRKLPDRKEPARAGGWGLYYHFDYVGDARNYKWVDTTSLANTWDQLHQAYEYGVDRLWVVNVGDLKGQELPSQFFLDYAWDPGRWPVERLGEWERRYAASHFPPEHAQAIAEVLHTYGRLQSRRKPELLNRRISVDAAKDLTRDGSAIVYDDEACPFSLTDYREMERVAGEWRRLAERAGRIGDALPPACQDAYYQLVRYQVEASANLYALRQAQFLNLWYARQGRAATNALAAEAEARFAADQAMSDHYNTVLAGGKWHGFQTQPKIGYGDVRRYGPDATWQQPQRNHEALPDEIFPALRRIELPAVAELGVAVDGSADWWPAQRSPGGVPPAGEPATGGVPGAGEPVLPAFSPYQSQPPQYIEVFSRGSVGFDCSVRPGVDWLRAEPPAVWVDTQVRVELSVDWSAAPGGTTRVPITASGPLVGEVTVWAPVEHPDPSAASPAGYVEAGGYISIEAEHCTNAVNTSDVWWRRIPDIGRTGSGMEPFPVTAPRQVPGGDSPRLEYEMTLWSTGPVAVWAYLSPRNSTLSPDGLEYAISIDDAVPQTVNITSATGADDTAMNRQWQRNTSDNVNLTRTVHRVDRPGRHVLKFWMVDPTVVVQKLVVDTGGLRPSYLGPPESYRADDRGAGNRGAER